MRVQVLQSGRLAVPRQIGRAGHRHLRHQCDAPPRQRRVLQFAGAQHAVHAFTHQVHVAVVLAQVQRDVGVAREETGQPRHHEIPRQRALRVHSQQALGRLVQEGAVGFLQVGQQAHAAPVVDLAVVGQADLARGALQQPRAQALFQALDQVGDGGGRNPQILGRLEKLWRSAMRANTCISWKRSMGLGLLFMQMKLCLQI